jgi:hypothetical protein
MTGREGIKINEITLVKFSMIQSYILSKVVLQCDIIYTSNTLISNSCNNFNLCKSTCTIHTNSKLRIQQVPQTHNMMCYILW